MGSTAGGMAIVAGGGKVHTTQSRLTVDAALIKFHCVTMENLVLFRQVQILMAVAAGSREIQGIDHRFLVARRKNIVSAMTVGAGGDVLTGCDVHPPMPLVDLSRIVVAITAFDLRQLLLVRQFLNALVTIQTFEVLVDRDRYGTINSSVTFSEIVTLQTGGVSGIKIILCKGRRRRPKQG